MRITAIFVNKIELKKNDGEISHTTSQHATLDRHDDLSHGMSHGIKAFIP